MNPLTNIKNLNAMNERELSMGVAGTKNSWHNQYKDSAWVFVGGLPYELTEGDIIAVLSQYGEIVHINLVRDQQSGKSKGFGFVCYEDQRSTILAVDNLNGIRLCKRTIRVDHVQTYKLPKDLERMDTDRKRLFLEGCAPKPLGEEDGDDNDEFDKSEDDLDKEDKKAKKKKKKHKKEKKKKKDKEKSKTRSSSDDESDEERRNQRSGSPKQSHNRDRSLSPSPPRWRKDEVTRRDRRDDRSRRSRSRSREKRYERSDRRRSRSRSRERGFRGVRDRRDRR